MVEVDTEEQRAFRALDAAKYKEAARLYETLAEQGSETALLNLGWMLESGHLGQPDREKAMLLWERAANGGSLTAKYSLGRAWKEKGDLRRARALFIDGAERGHKPSMFMAGRMLVRGEGGEADCKAGEALLLRASREGHMFARRELSRLKINRARSPVVRLVLYCEMLLTSFATLPRYVRNPNSDDFR